MPQIKDAPIIIREKSKVVGPRISDASQKFYGIMFESINQGEEYALEAFPHLYQHTIESLKGRFTRGELMVVIDASNGLTFTAIMAGQHLDVQVADGIALDHLAEKWEVDGAKLNDKIAALSIFEAACLELWVNAFWSQDDHGNVEAYVAELVFDNEKIKAVLWKFYNSLPTRIPAECEAMLNEAIGELFEANDILGTAVNINSAKSVIAEIIKAIPEDK